MAHKGKKHIGSLKVERPLTGVVGLDTGSSKSNASKDILLGLLPTELCTWVGGGSRL